MIALVRYDSRKTKITRNHQFPIESDCELFKRHEFASLAGIRKEHSALIERLQPYNGCKWSQLLAGFSNMDKHRGLVAVDLEESIRIETFLTDFRERTIGSPREVDVYRIHEREIVLSDGTPVIQALNEIRTAVGLMGWTQPSLFKTASDRARMVRNHQEEKRGRVRDEG